MTGAIVAERMIGHKRRRQPLQRGLKRGMDIIVSATSLVALLPTMILTAVATKLTSRGTDTLPVGRYWPQRYAIQRV